MPQRPIFRFAPSPNGELHLGHALSALINYEQAKEAGGIFLLRIEDIDLTRSRETHVEGIFTDLAWLGLDWPEPVLRQSTRFAAYRAAAARLLDMGLLYPCFASRRDIALAAETASSGHDPDGAPLYPMLHKNLPPADIAARKSRGERFALRLDMARAIDYANRLLAGRPLMYKALAINGTCTRIRANPARWGDAVIVRKDVDASYHLAVVVDDAFQQITHVTRGADLAAATDLHVLLQVLLELPQPLYHHHRLLMDENGRKLAKSAKDQSLRALRESGCTPADIRRLVGLD